MSNRLHHRRYLVPEVVQTSAMDCGPASLKCLLEGYGINVSYGRLREACQTDVDGTSIDTMEAVAGQLGLEAEQVMLPPDHLLLSEAEALPALVVIRIANGNTHFSVIWRRHGSLVQMMDPATGRRWLTCETLLRELYLHTATIPAEAWRGWIEGETFLGALRHRLRELRVSNHTINELIKDALNDSGWRVMATLDAATRLTTEIVRAGGLSKGHQAAEVLISFTARARENNADELQTIPENYWMVRPAEPDAEGNEQVKMRGAVLVSVRGRQQSSSANAQDAEPPPPLSTELQAALSEKPGRPGRELFRLLRQDGLLTPLMLLIAIALAAGGMMIETLLFQGLFDLSRKLGPTEQRLGTMMALLIFSVAMLMLELPLALGALRIGRHLEARLRIAFLEKIPRLGDRYFQSRLISDMAERSHSTQCLRALPQLGSRFLRHCFELLLTTAGLIWLDPDQAWVVVIVALLAVALPLAMQSRLTERDLRIRNHNGALSRFYLDAMLGLVPIRAHGAERAVRREHESLLVEWMRASYGYARAVLAVESVQSLTGFVLAAWLLFAHLSQTGATGAVLLMVYWALNLPALGQEIATLAQQYPGLRNVTLRLLEPLGAPEEERQGDGVTRERGDEVFVHSAAGVALTFDGVTVRAGGHVILDELALRIEPGSHVAIVGPSGAGKSSFAGLLLGWHRAANGRVLADGAELTSERIEQLRSETAWVDPAIQLWNRSFIDNLRYGNTDHANDAANLNTTVAANTPGEIIEAADLRRVLEKLPDGLQTMLGESGGLVSGGEGQRVRFGRALFRSNARLVILDEPFRGLDREKRRELLSRARQLWRNATLLCITHDVGETRDFERVLVMDKGRVVEDGAAINLAAQPASFYRRLLDAEDEVRHGMWASDEWRRLYVDGGKLFEKKSDELRLIHTGELRRVG